MKYLNAFGENDDDEDDEELERQSLAKPALPAKPLPPRLVLNEDQQQAREEILTAAESGGRHLLTGYAGTGKTTLLETVVTDLRRSLGRPS